MTTRIILAIAILLSVAACKIGGDETNAGAGATCSEVNTACARNQDCCSYGCVAGLCVVNPAEGGTCRTTNDCFTGRLCKSGACTTQTPGMCRDTADVCSLWNQCCSGNCEAGDCTTNRSPTADAGDDVLAPPVGPGPGIPYTQPYTLTNRSADPDLDPLTFGWTLEQRPPGSLAALGPATATNPSFTPDVTGTYVVRLVVTEGPAGAPDRYVLEDRVTLVAVNQPPVVTAAAPAPANGRPRNVQLRITGNVRDDDGDDLQCEWRVTAPGETTPTIVVPFTTCGGNPSAPFLDYTPVGEGDYHVDLAVRDFVRGSTTMVMNTTVARATFTSINNAPEPATTRMPYYANMGATVDTTPSVMLDASPSTDPNGDHLIPDGVHLAPPYLSFFWEMVSALDGGTLPALAGETTATPSFTPNRATTYVLQVTVSDVAQFNRPSASKTMQVSVEVGRYVQPLRDGHDVADAARASAAGKIVLAGRDPTDTTKGMIWVYDMATGTEGAGIRLVDPGDGSSAIPRLVDVTPDGTKAVVVDEAVSIWIVNLGPTPSMSRVPQPFAVAQCVVGGNRNAFLFRTGGTDYMRELDLTTGTISQPPGASYSFRGAVSNGATTLLYRVTAYDWYRYTVNNSGGLSQTNYSSTVPSCGGTAATAIWGTLDGTYVVSSCGQVYNGTTLAILPSTLGVSPSYVDSTLDGSLLVTAGTSLQRFGAALGAPAGTDLLPKWSQDGYGRTATASKAFFDGAGAKRFAVVHDTATPRRYGIITFP